MINWQRKTAAILILVHPVTLTLLVAVWAVNIPFWDQWEFITILEKYRLGTLGLSDFFAQHNEHRLLFPRLIMFVLALATHWNILAEVAVNLLLAFGSFLLLYRLLQRTVVSETGLWGSAFVVGLILFSPAQYWNWLWGWQIAWFLNVFCLIAAAWALCAWQHPSNLVRVVVAGVAAFVATFSLASGTLVWFLCLPLLIASSNLRKYVVPWIVTTAVVLVLYFWNYEGVSHLPSKTELLRYPADVLEYGLVYLARPVAIVFSASIPTAIVYLALIVVFGWADARTVPTERSLLLPWLVIGLYGVLTAALAAVSRAGLGVAQAYSSRYITLSSLVLIAVVVALFKFSELSNARPWLRRLSSIALFAIVLMVGANWAQGFMLMQRHHLMLARARSCALLAVDPACPYFADLYPDTEILLQRIRYLRTVHQGGF